MSDLKIKKINVLANGYGVYKDIDDNLYFIMPEAEAKPREEWFWFELQNIIYVYVKLDYE